MYYPLFMLHGYEMFSCTLSDPARPGQLNLEASNLSAPNITLRWAASTGYVDRYKIGVTGQSNVITASNETGQSNVFTASNETGQSNVFPASYETGQSNMFPVSYETGQSNVFTASNETEITIPGLEAGKQYEVRITAESNDRSSQERVETITTNSECKCCMKQVHQTKKTTDTLHQSTLCLATK